MVFIRSKLLEIKKVPEAVDYVDYFEFNYIRTPIKEAYLKENGSTGIRTTGYKDAMFPPRQWSMYEAVKTNTAKTNNVCEGWNNSFKALVGHVHPCLWKVSLFG